MTERARTGNRGESLAAKLLESKGFSILKRNYSTRFGEIDIIAQNGAYLVFAEVKTRSPGGLGTPGEAVDTRKMQRIIKTAGYWMLEHPTERQPRFDVIEVILPERGEPELNHIVNAFGAFGH